MNLHLTQNQMRTSAGRLIARSYNRLFFRKTVELNRFDWEADGYDYGHMVKSALFAPEPMSVFVPVSSAASRSFSGILFDNQSERDSDDRTGLRGQGFQKAQSYSILPDLMASGTFRTFTLVRHPVSRFLSAVRDQIYLRNSTPLRSALGKFFKRDATDDFSVGEILTYVENTPSHMVEEHVAPQWSLNGAGRIPFAYVAKAERLQSDVIRLCEMGLIKADVVSTRGAPNKLGGSHLAEELTTPVLVRLQSAYRRDYELFHYT